MSYTHEMFWNISICKEEVSNKISAMFFCLLFITYLLVYILRDAIEGCINDRFLSLVGLYKKNLDNSKVLSEYAYAEESS